MVTFFRPPVKYSNKAVRNVGADEKNKIKFCFNENDNGNEADDDDDDDGDDDDDSIDLASQLNNFFKNLFVSKETMSE